MSLESRYGWHDLYISLGAWPERISQTVSNGQRDRDELDFYLCFFTQCWSLTDWVIENQLLSKPEIMQAVDSYDCMRICRDIATRYKHLTMNSIPKYDRDWSIWVDHQRTDKAFSLTAKGTTWLLWDLMIECLSFWEACAAAYNLAQDRKVFRPQ